MQRVTYDNINHRHEEIGKVEKAIRAHIGWAVNNKDRETLLSTVATNEELFFFQTDSKDTIIGFEAFVSLVNDVFMHEDFKAIRTEINNLRIHVSPTLRTSWFSCFLNDYNEYKGEPMVWENVRWTGVLERVGEEWKIFQMHFSKAEDQIHSRER